jgi:hypothetical protein
MLLTLIYICKTIAPFNSRLYLLYILEMTKKLSIIIDKF